MKIFTLFLALIFSFHSIAQVPSDPSFFANAQIQKLAPEAFATQSQAIPFLKTQRALFQQEVLKLVNSIHADRNLLLSITEFQKLNLDQKTLVMKKVFAHVVRVLAITPPELVIDNEFKNATYFDSDLKNPGPGRVILSPKELSAMQNPYAPILFLIHETRHSAQFQLAFSKRANILNTLAKGYIESFKAQNSLRGKLSYCDFLTLLNEYDAFQYGNAVVSLLTKGKSNDETMGTYASQFDNRGNLKIDLIKIFETYGANNLLPTFNLLEIPQWKIIKGQGRLR